MCVLCPYCEKLTGYVGNPQAQPFSFFFLLLLDKKLDFGMHMCTARLFVVTCGGRAL